MDGVFGKSSKAGVSEVKATVPVLKNVVPITVGIAGPSPTLSRHEVAS